MNCKTVVGIYGVPGSGKSTLLSLIQKSHLEWRCLEGSQVIGMVMEQKGKTMMNFHEKSDTEKASIRACAIKMIHDYKGVTVVAGHCSLPVVARTEEEWNPTEPIAFEDVFTAKDGDLFDVILYLEEVYMHRTNDNKTSKSVRPELSVEAIKQWIKHEKKVLEKECVKYNIDFSLVSDKETTERSIATHVLGPLVLKLQADSLLALKTEIEKIPESDVFLLIDEDWTLCTIDTLAKFSLIKLRPIEDP